MATLTYEIILDGYRESNLIALNATPTGAQEAEALRALRRLIASLYGHEEGEELISIPVGDADLVRPYGYTEFTDLEDWTDGLIPPNSRLVCNLAAPLTLYLNPDPTDGERFAVIDSAGTFGTTNLTIKGNGRRIDGGREKVLGLVNINIEFMYREDLGEWVKISPVDTQDLWPFPTAYDDLFITGLAMRLNPRYEQDADPQTVAAYRRSIGAFKAKYRQSKDADLELALTNIGATKKYYSGYNPFTRGVPFFFGRIKPW